MKYPNSSAPTPLTQAFFDQSSYDIVIIGAGINGAGIARDAALRGLKTLILDKDDFCSGATSWSTRLVHGGLRYLEYFELNLVRESLKEREILLRIAPHLVHPLLLTIPIYRDRSRPYWKIQAGMRLYDVLSYDKTLPPHRMLNQSVFQQMFRAMDAENLAGGAQYYDAQVAYAERLALENILDAESAGATVLNYTEVTALHRKGDRIVGLSCRHRYTQDTYEIAIPDHGTVLNTAGAWVDAVLQCGERDGQAAAISKEPKIGPTKGSHIVVPPFPGAPQDSAFYVEAKSDGRPFFIVPWLGQILIGTTDIRYSGNLDEIKATDTEIDYLIQETNRIIPSAQITHQDILYTYSGVRPLPYSAGKKTSSITRSHVLCDHSPDGARNLVSLIGGKITTYRQVGEEVVADIAKRQGRSLPSCETQDRPLPGSVLPNNERLRALIDQYRDRIPVATLEHLCSLYGARTPELLALVDGDLNLAKPLPVNAPAIGAQVVFAVQTEYAQTLVDILHRRTLLDVHGDYGLPMLTQVTQLLETYCGWSHEKSQDQMRQYGHYQLTHCIPDFAVEQYQAQYPHLFQASLAKQAAS